MKKNFSLLFICILSIFLSLFIVGYFKTLNQLNEIKNTSQKDFLNYQDIGLENFFYAGFDEMYVASGWNPYLEGYFFDSEILEEMKHILLYGGFIEIPTPDFSNDSIFGTPKLISFFNENSQYYFYWYGETRVKIIINDEERWYSSTIVPQLKELIDRTCETYKDEF